VRSASSQAIRCTKLRVYNANRHSTPLTYNLLKDLKIWADFMPKLRMFYETLNMLEHRPEVSGDIFRDAKLLGFINKVAANLYCDPVLNRFGVAEKVKALINTHVSARGGDPKIPPTTITDAEFERVLAG
jgi:type I restriction enzyme, R subunit